MLLNGNQNIKEFFAPYEKIVGSCYGVAL